MVIPEILAPAGNLEKLKFAVIYGADAVYLGGKMFGLRAGAGNFTMEELSEGVEFAHLHGVKVYVTVNIFAHNEDLVGLPEYLKALQEKKVDALICADPGIISIAQEVVPDMELHLSTQANNTNWASALFWNKLGIKRVVVARELSLEEMREIANKAPVELEAFVHGAMCISYSGRCLLSNYFAGRDANRGECAHPCRWNYHLMEENRTKQYFPIEEDERGTYIFNSKDLCLLPHLPEMYDAGITSFKIEGRVKSAFYVATIVKVYKEARDVLINNRDEYLKSIPGWMDELRTVSHRDYTTGFYENKPNHTDQKYDTSSYIRTYEFVGLVLQPKGDNGLTFVEQRNNFKVGDELEIFGPHTPPQKFILEEMYDEQLQPITVAPHPKQKLFLKVPFSTETASFIRRKEK